MEFFRSTQRWRLQESRTPPETAVCSLERAMEKRDVESDCGWSDGMDVGGVFIGGRSDNNGRLNDTTVAGQWCGLEKCAYDACKHLDRAERDVKKRDTNEAGGLRVRDQRCIR